MIPVHPPAATVGARYGVVDLDSDLALVIKGAPAGFTFEPGAEAGSRVLVWLGAALHGRRPHPAPLRLAGVWARPGFEREIEPGHLMAVVLAHEQILAPCGTWWAPQVQVVATISPRHPPPPPVRRPFALAILAAPAALLLTTSAIWVALGLQGLAGPARLFFFVTLGAALLLALGALGACCLALRHARQQAATKDERQRQLADYRRACDLRLALARKHPDALFFDTAASVAAYYDLAIDQGAQP